MLEIVDVNAGILDSDSSVCVVCVKANEAFLELHALIV